MVEAVFEDRTVKAETIARAEAAIGAGVVFGSNTSTLPITSLAKESKRPAQFIGVHFFSPVEKMMLVEIILGKKTGEEALAVALDYVRAIRKTPIVVNDSRGFFTSRVVSTYLREGHLMLTEGIPAAMIENVGRMAGMPVGPLSLNDEVAVDLAWKILKATEADLGPAAVVRIERITGHQGRVHRRGAPLRLTVVAPLVTNLAFHQANVSNLLGALLIVSILRVQDVRGSDSQEDQQDRSVYQFHVSSPLRSPALAAKCKVSHCPQWGKGPQYF